jgi:uncharacterized membrane protein YkoI
MRKTVQTLFAAMVLSFGLSSVAYADDDIQEIQQISQSFGLISLEEAKVKALAAKPGVIGDAELESRKFKKGWDYEFEILDADGTEWEVLIDAKTGKVNNISRDWF